MKLLWLCMLVAPVLAVGPGSGNLGRVNGASLGGLQSHGTGANLGFSRAHTLTGGLTTGLGGQTSGLNAGTTGLGGNLAGLHGTGLLTGQGVAVGGHTDLGSLTGGQTGLGGLSGGHIGLSQLNVGQAGLGGLVGTQAGLSHLSEGQAGLGGLVGGQTGLNLLTGGQAGLGGLVGGQTGHSHLTGGQAGLGGLVGGQTGHSHLTGGQVGFGGLVGGQTGHSHLTGGQAGLGGLVGGQTGHSHLTGGEAGLGGLASGHGVTLGGQTGLGGLAGGHSGLGAGQDTILGGGGLAGLNAGFGLGQGASVIAGQGTSLAGGLGHGIVGQQGVGQLTGGLAVGNAGILGSHGVSVAGLGTGIGGSTGGLVTQGNVGVTQAQSLGASHGFVTGHSGFTGAQGVAVTGGQAGFVGGQNIGVIGGQDIRFRTHPSSTLVSHKGIDNDDVHTVGLGRKKKIDITVVKEDFGGSHIVDDSRHGEGDIAITLVRDGHAVDDRRKNIDISLSKGGFAGGRGVSLLSGKKHFIDDDDLDHHDHGFRGSQRGVTIIRSKDGLGAFDGLRGLEVGGRDVSIVRGKGQHRGSLDVVRGGFRTGLRSRVLPAKGVRVTSSLGSRHSLTQIHPSSGRSRVSFNLGHGGRRSHKLGKGAIILH